jgi:hypothetical protein
MTYAHVARSSEEIRVCPTPNATTRQQSNILRPRRFHYG